MHTSPGFFISNHESAQNRCTVLKFWLRFTKIKETENPLEEFESVIYKPIHVAMFGKRLQKTMRVFLYKLVFNQERERQKGACGVHAKEESVM